MLQGERVCIRDREKKECVMIDKVFEMKSRTRLNWMSELGEWTERT